MNSTPKGRGTGVHTPNRFQRFQTSKDEEWSHGSEETSDPNTLFITENSKSIVSVSNSPDLAGFTSINPYRGCEHGCIYCYARNSHEYWGYSAGLDFESKIIVKRNAPSLLEKLFNSPSWEPRVIHLSGNTDCYQPAEKKFGITRKLLEVCLKYRNPVAILTKNALVARDIDLLKKLAQLNLTSVAFSITTLDEKVRRTLEPRTPTGQRKLATMKRLYEEGIPVGVMTAPLIPGLNDHEIAPIIEASSEHGACWAGYTIVRLNGVLGELFKEWAYRNFPDRADKMLNQIKSCHGGQLNDSKFFRRSEGEGAIAESIRQMHRIACQRFLNGRSLPSLDTTLFFRGGQLKLF